MRSFLYFILPTLAGWFAGWATCLTCLGFVDHSVPTSRDLSSTAMIAGLFIVTPTYLLLVLPYSLLCRRCLRHGENLSAWPLCLLIFIFGGVVTYIPMVGLFSEQISLSSHHPVDNPLLFFFPFGPYAVITALLVSQLAKWSLGKRAS